MAKLSAVPTTSVQTALEEVFHSGQQLILDRLDLLQYELQNRTTRVTQVVVFSVIAGVFGLAALILLSVSFGQFLATLMPTHAATACVGLTYLVVALASWAWQRFKVQPTPDATEMQ